jgi:hypothetical protein
MPDQTGSEFANDDGDFLNGGQIEAKFQSESFRGCLRANDIVGLEDHQL